MKHILMFRRLVVVAFILTVLASYLSYAGDLKQGARTIQAPPELFVPADLFPSNGKYESIPGAMITWPMGISLRYLGERNFSQFDTLPLLGGGWKIYSYNSTTDFDVSLDGGMTWIYGAAPAFNSVRLNHVADTGATRYFDAEVLALNISGGSLPGGIRIRESPTLASTGKVRVTSGGDGYTIDSFFDIFIELSIDGGMSWYPASAPLTVEFSYYPAESFFITNLFPPATSIFVSRPGETITFVTGAMVRNIVKRHPDASITPPPPGLPVIHSYNDEITFQFSPDMGGTWMDVTAFCANNTQLTYTAGDPPATLYSAEHLSMTISGGTIPGGILFRESPTLASTGQYTTRVTMIGYMINSFFDVFLEMSSDGGGSWAKADKPIMIEMQECPTIIIEPATLPVGRLENEYSQTLIASGGTPPYTFTLDMGKLPPDVRLSTDGVISGTPSDYGFYLVSIIAEDQNHCQATNAYKITVNPAGYFCGSDVFPPYGRYVNKPGDLLNYPMGIQIRNLVHRMMRPFDTLPDLGMQQSYPFTGFLSCEVSIDQGATWTYCETQTQNSAILEHTADSSEESFFDIEITKMDILGGGLPMMMMIRESPTLKSEGRLVLREQAETGDPFLVESFFDIYTEISLDGGGTWSPAISDLYMELHYLPATFTDSDNFPPEEAYNSGKDKVLYWHHGVALRNMKHYDLIPQGVPPPIGELKLFNYTGMTEFELSLDNGITWMEMQASATNSATLDHFADDSKMSFYDTEMLQMDITGGTLPPGVIIRESPTRSSTGEFNARAITEDNWHVDSFFDIFFEISMDAGQSWAPAAEPLELVLNESTLEIEVNPSWNMISLPLIVDDPLKITLFPTAISPAFAFEGTYVEKETLNIGTGYWLKFGGSETISISGSLIFEDTIDVVEGWNLIGSISLPVDVTEITSIPPGIVTSEFFGYTTAYNSTDTIHPGNGYWVKVSESGKLILSIYDGEKLASEKIRIAPMSELPPAPPEDDNTPRDQATIPLKTALHQNSPNPFNPTTKMSFVIGHLSLVKLRIFNVIGEEVGMLVNEVKQPGEYSVEWNAESIPSGVYYYRLEANATDQSGKHFISTNKMILLK